MNLGQVGAGVIDGTIWGGRPKLVLHLMEAIDRHIFEKRR